MPLTVWDVPKPPFGIRDQRRLLWTQEACVLRLWVQAPMASGHLAGEAIVMLHLLSVCPLSVTLSSWCLLGHVVGGFVCPCVAL